MYVQVILIVRLHVDVEGAPALCSVLTVLAFERPLSGVLSDMDVKPLLVHTGESTHCTLEGADT